MEAVLSWVKQIFILSILSTVVRIVYLRTADCHGVYTAACGSFSRRHFTG